jgi:hypothetical protein
MHRHILLAIITALALGLVASPALAAPSIPWATQAGGSSNESGKSVSMLPDGSSIVTGPFSGTATFGSTTLTSVGTVDVFVAKVNPSGAWVWATRAGGDDFLDYSRSFGVNALPDGSAIVTGSFDGTATFGSTPTLTSAGAQDVFVAKVSPSGAWVWATRAGGDPGDQGYGYGVSALPDGSAIVTGWFDGTATFGTTPTLTSAGARDVFVAKVSPSGVWVWATRADGSLADESFGVSALPDGSAIVTGPFEGTATFGSTTFTSAGGTDVFVAKMDPSGAWVWATRAGGSSAEESLGVSALPDGSAIVTGWFTDTATFGTSPTLTSAGAEDVFVARVDPSGAWVWATRAGGSSADESFGVSALPDGSAIVTGSFQGTATFGTTPTLTSAGDEDVFVAKFLDASQAPSAPQAATAAAKATAIRLTVLPSKTRLRSGQTMRIAIRTANGGTATVASVTTCLTLPANLVVTRTGGAQRVGRSLCFSLGNLAAGATRTRAVHVRAVTLRTVTRRVIGTARSSTTSASLTTARSSLIRITPLATPAESVTG